jgi:hypothetical protein
VVTGVDARDIKAVLFTCGKTVLSQRSESGLWRNFPSRGRSEFNSDPQQNITILPKSRDSAFLSRGNAGLIAYL